MSKTVEELFQDAIKRYEDGESHQDLIPVFTSICQQAPKFAAAWTCLSWLHLLNGQADPAHKAAQTAVKLDPVDAQPRVNLTLAMLEGGKKGVRQQVEIIKQILIRDEEQVEVVRSNLADGQGRRPDWKHLEKLQSWLGE
jgi:predicted Zn-dependent protease